MVISVLNNSSTSIVMSYRTLALHRAVLRRSLPATAAYLRRHYQQQQQQRPVSAMVVLTASAATTFQQQQHSMSTLAEPLDKVPLGSTSTTTTNSAATAAMASRQLHHTTTNEHASHHNHHHHHHFYGSPLVAQDIYYNEIVKEGLGTMRRQHATQSAAVAARHEEHNDHHEEENDDATRHAVVNNDDDDRKALSILERSGHRNAATLTLIGYKGGIGDDQINQDRAVVISPFVRAAGVDGSSSSSSTEATQESCLVGVFDGHGPLGELVSDYSVSELPRLLARKLKAAAGRLPSATATSTTNTAHNDETVKQILIDSFIEIDKNAPAEKSGGCTASVILQLGNKLYVANAGDSRSFIVCYRKRTKVASIVYISREDKPHLPEEKARLEKLGGFVAMPTLHGATSRVYYTNPNNGFVSGLAMSRSIGDRLAGKLGVIPDPLVEVMDIPELVDATRNNRLATPSFVVVNGYLSLFKDENDGSAANEDDVHIFAVSATDGLMDYLRQETIAATLAHSLFEEEGPHLLTACEALIKGAAAGWHTVHRGRYRDDIAIAVSRIRIPPSTTSPTSASVSSS